MSKVLTEKSDILSYVKEDLGENKHYLGKLAGIGAEFNKPTRNGRRYPLELWKNVEKSDDFKEGMQTHTIFGECDHPEERVETSIKEIAIVLTKFEIREKEGNVYTEFHILDTPNGRILKELLDYGSQIGVSTRGLGDEIVKDGETIIDPDTFCFFGWDAVIMPAVKSARPEVVESKKRQSLIESFTKQIQDAVTTDEVKSIQRMVEKMPELDSIKESINNKLKSMSDGDNISEQLEKDLGKISEENMTLTEQVETLKSKLTANNIRVKKLKESNAQHREVEKSLRKRLEDYMVNSAELQESLYDVNKNYLNAKSRIERTEKVLESKVRSLKSTKNEMEAIVNENKSLSGRNKILINENSRLKSNYNRVVSESKSIKSVITKNKKSINDSSSEICELKKVIESLNSQVTTLKSENSKLLEQLKSSTSKQALIEQRSAKELSSCKNELEKTNAVISLTLDKYLSTTCAQNGIKEDTVKRLLPEKYTTDDIDKTVSELSDRQRRYNALPFELPIHSARIVESVQNSNMSEEDKQTLAFINSACQ